MSDKVKEFYLCKDFWGEDYDIEKLEKLRDLPMEEFLQQISNLRSLKYCVCDYCQKELGEFGPGRIGSQRKPKANKKSC